MAGLPTVAETNSNNGVPNKWRWYEAVLLIKLIYTTKLNYTLLNIQKCVKIF